MQDSICRRSATRGEHGLLLRGGVGRSGAGQLPEHDVRSAHPRAGVPHCAPRAVTVLLSQLLQLLLLQLKLLLLLQDDRLDHATAGTLGAVGLGGLDIEGGAAGGGGYLQAFAARVVDQSADHDGRKVARHVVAERGRALDLCAEQTRYPS